MGDPEVMFVGHIHSSLAIDENIIHDIISRPTYWTHSHLFYPWELTLDRSVHGATPLGVVQSLDLSNHLLRPMGNSVMNGYNEGCYMQTLTSRGPQATADNKYPNQSPRCTCTSAKNDVESCSRNERSRSVLRLPKLPQLRHRISSATCLRHRPRCASLEAAHQ